MIKERDFKKNRQKKKPEEVLPFTCLFRLAVYRYLCCPCTVRKTFAFSSMRLRI
jgi:hypothetical protein